MRNNKWPKNIHSWMCIYVLDASKSICMLFRITVPMHAPQTKAFWWREVGGTTKAFFLTLPRRVGDVEGRAVLHDGWNKPRCACWQAVYSQNRDDYGVQGCGQRGGGSEVWSYSRDKECCEGERQGVRSLWSMEYVALNTKTNRGGAVARGS